MRALALLMCVAACDGAGSDAAQPRVDDLEGGLRALNRAVGLSTAFLGLGVVDSNADPTAIALAIYQHFKAQTGTCAMATPSGPVVSVDLGKGCTLSTAGFVAGGTATVTVTKPSPMPLNVHFDYSLTVGVESVSGTLEANASAGSSFDYGAVAKSGATLSLPFFTAGVAGGGVQVTGMGTLTGKKNSMVNLTALHQRFDACYPDEGSVRVQDSGVDFTVSFANGTPSSGQVTVHENGADRTLTLPSRSGCPH